LLKYFARVSLPARAARGIYKTTDGGKTWQRILYGNEKTGAIDLVMDPVDANTLYAATWQRTRLKWNDPRNFPDYSGSGIHKSTDGGKTWTEIMNGLPYQKWVSRLAASAYSLGTVYMTQNGKRDDDFTPYVWKSTDFGRNWTSITGNIPIGPVNVIREDPANEDVLYVGTDAGVYVTSNGGKSWEVLGANLPATYVQDLIIHPRDNIVVVATHGRGMWALDATTINKRGVRRN
jgi:photosystem II stability/assembly factor-like uncharacterized protein